MFINSFISQFCHNSSYFRENLILNMVTAFFNGVIGFHLFFAFVYFSGKL